ncbi:MAG: MFS transporter [Chloroflexota bacterium]
MPSSSDVPGPGTPTVRTIPIPNGLRAFRHRDYRIFWVAQLFSLTGTWLQSLAQSWLVLTLTDSPVLLGITGMLQFGPTLILGLPAGVIVDRYPKRRLLMVTQGCIGVITSVLAILVATGNVKLWQIWLAALLFGIVNAIDMPARQAFVTDMVGVDDTLNAVALNSALFNTSRVVGPAIAGVLLATLGAAPCFAINAITYFPVVIGLGLMHTTGAPTRAFDGTSVLHRLGEGLAHVRATPVVRLTIILVGFVSIFALNFTIWVPLLARNEMDVGPQGFGVLMSSLGAGALIGALVLAFTGRSPNMRRMLTTASILGALLIGLGLVAAIHVALPVAMLVIAGVGFCMTTTMATANSTVQTNTPQPLRGRVMSIYMTVFVGSTPIGALNAGLTAEAIGASAAVIMGGVVAIIVAGVLAVLARQAGALAITPTPAHLPGGA